MWASGCKDKTGSSLGTTPVGLVGTQAEGGPQEGGMSTWPVPFASAKWGAGVEWDMGQAGVAPWTDPPQFCCHVEKLRPREVQAHGWARGPSWAPGGPGPSWP